MDENTWRFAQLMMWLMGIQTTVLMAAIGFAWKNLSGRIDKIDEKISNIDKRLVAVETILHMKECCMLRDDQRLKKAE